MREKQRRRIERHGEHVQSRLNYTYANVRLLVINPFTSLSAHSEQSVFVYSACGQSYGIAISSQKQVSCVLWTARLVSVFCCCCFSYHVCSSRPTYMVYTTEYTTCIHCNGMPSLLWHFIVIGHCCVPNTHKHTPLWLLVQSSVKLVVLVM